MTMQYYPLPKNSTRIQYDCALSDIGGHPKPARYGGTEPPVKRREKEGQGSQGVSLFPSPVFMVSCCKEWEG